MSERNLIFKLGFPSLFATHWAINLIQVWTSWPFSEFFCTQHSQKSSAPWIDRTFSTKPGPFPQRNSVENEWLSDTRGRATNPAPAEPNNSLDDPDERRGKHIALVIAFVSFFIDDVSRFGD